MLVLSACGGTGSGPRGGQPADPPTDPTPSAAPATPDSGPTTAPRLRDAQTAQRVGAPEPEPPVLVVLPDGRPVPVRPATTSPRGRLEVPTDIREAGWWPGGARLGDPFGSTLLAAHVDSVEQGLGPFASLLRARTGDRLVLRSRHLTQTYVLASVRTVPKASFGTRPWLRSPEGRRRLTLVTCAPPYDAANGGYQNLAVLTASPVGGVGPRRTP
ncbi:hypothetical protein GCM10023340_04080 [Nocardioides marinquilinus]|uniref:Class F sortase n=1 Tax=Nocardioides marinquilinus TaxID=1210400 RepID=A0ABP9PD98_9ACTN